MLGFGRRARCVAVLALCSLAFMPGCDWLKASDMIERSSPFLSGLSISPSTVLCGSDYTVSFDYDDPQEDISQATVTLQHEGDSSVSTETFSWPDDLSRGAGTASFDLSTSCDSADGTWSVSVEVEDDRGHTSNILTGEISLSAAG